ncbi:Y-family DNA polymerase [Bacterioplanoides sp.]|uniref:Y-family DNA polymerase n=1 Tax=Bacterioplanoides sp. TaxID=2066072 RepID=UPI003B5A51D5
MNIWLYLYFPDLYLHSFHQQQAGPFALLELRGGQHYVCQRNTLAANAGIEVDMPLASALCLCNDLQTSLLDPHKAEQLLQQQALWAYRFSAQVCLDQPQGLWLEAASMQNLFGGVSALCQQIQQQAEQHQWPLQIAVGYTPAVAKVLAVNNGGKIQQLPHPLERQQLRLDNQQQLRHLSIAQLGLAESHQLALQRLGVHHYHQLLKLPLSELASRFDSDLIHWLMQLSGDKPTTMTFFQPPLDFCDEALFIHEVEHINGLLFPLRRQLSALSAFLHKRQLAIDHVSIQLKHRQQADSPQEDSYWLIRFARAEFRQQELTQLIRYQLEKKTLAAPVREMVLKVREFVSQQPEQTDYWPDSAAHNREHGQQLLNRLQARLEHNQLFRLTSNADARPDYAWQALQAEQGYPEKNSHRVTSPNGRPLWLLAQAIPCEKPDNIIAGPERISSGWWQHGQQQQRDYYQVIEQQQDSQRHLWVFRDASKQWFIQGYFS